ncbi:MAG TPA: hypothetical protein VLW85_04240 [Myxococcales bacterium]|nr:hypothetical protein [Myxococcales bacterium]
MDRPPRQGLGQFFRALCDFIDERGLREQVKALVSAETRQLMERPPRPLAFLPSRPIDEVEATLQKLAGVDACVEAGLAVARPLGWTLLRPVLRMVFQLFGQSPEPVFGNLDRFFSLVTRGIDFSWDGRERVVMARFAGEGTPEAAYHVLRGTLLFAFEVSGTVGEVSTPEVVESTPSLSVVRYRVSWR